MDIGAGLKHVGNFVIYLSPSIVGVFVGGFLVQRYWAKKANESNLIEYLTKELNDLVDETLEYWSIDCSGTAQKADAERKSARKLEAKIKGAVKNLNSVISHYSERYCKKKKDFFTALMGEVNDACTGGEFEVKDRAPEAHRFLTIVNATTRVRVELLRRRV
jgi:hypothetical protein